MADKNDGADKTEKPTPKKIKDARKKGDVPKSKDITSTLALIMWLLILALGTGYASERISILASTILTIPNEDFFYTLQIIGKEALYVLMIVSASFLIPIIVFSLLVEFLQTGPIMTFEKMKPKMEHLNPAEGLKRMFSMDNFVEVIKSIIKTAILFFIGWLVFKHFIGDIMLLPHTSASAFSDSLWDILFYFLVWTIGIFVFVAIVDHAYQKHSFTKKMRMSMRDIKQEMKDSEGDPMVKQERRQLHQEWSEEGYTAAATNADALIVNPTHIAIALNYNKETSPVPIITAIGQDEIAQKMRDAAKEAEVPVIRNIELARTLLKDAEEGEMIPRALFDIIAEVILWAQEVKKEIEKQKIIDHAKSNQEEEKTQRPPPGEDLTYYPKSTMATHGTL